MCCWAGSQWATSGKRLGDVVGQEDPGMLTASAADNSKVLLFCDTQGLAKYPLSLVHDLPHSCGAANARCTAYGPSWRAAGSGSVYRARRRVAARVQARAGRGAAHPAPARGGHPGAGARRHGARRIGPLAPLRAGVVRPARALQHGLQPGNSLLRQLPPL